MSKWNIYQKDADGLWDIVETVESETKPKIKRGQKISKRLKTVVMDHSNYDPRLAYPAAHGLSKRKGL